MSDVAIKFFRYQADTKPIMIFLSLFFLDLVVFYFNPSPILAFTYAVLFFFSQVHDHCLESSSSARANI